MFTHISLRSVSCIGLDIKPDAIRLLHLSKAKAQSQIKLTLENFAVATLPPETIVDGKIKQLDILQAALNRLVSATKTKHYLTAIALPAHSVISKRIKLPTLLNSWEREVEISLNLKRYLPDVNEELSFDFVNLNPVDAEYQEVLLMASKREQLNTYTNIAMQAGLNVKIVDVDVYALAHALLYYLPAAIKRLVAILHVDVNGCQFIVSQQGQIIFYQAWQAINQDFIESQLKRALVICLSRYKQLPLQDLILSGKISLENTFLQRDFSIRTHVSHPFVDMQIAALIDTKELRSSMSNLLTACGLAMRGMAYVGN